MAMQSTLPELTAVLSRTPSVLRALLAGLPEELLLANEGEATFSPRDVIGHLIHAEKTDWMVRVRLILERGEAHAFAPFDRFAFRDGIQAQSTASLLDEFDAVRGANLADLDAQALTSEHLARRGRHPEFGPVTLGQLIATWATHDLDHIGQIARVMAKRYTADVGPWKAFLGILNR
jgi:hypothetical protein